MIKFVTKLITLQSENNNTVSCALHKRKNNLYLQYIIFSRISFYYLVYSSRTDSGKFLFNSNTKKKGSIINVR